jgi:hypothetical protein
MQYKAFEPGIEVNGQTVYAIVDGFRISKKLPSKILLAEGIGKADASGLVEVDPVAWYSQEAWLRAFKRIAKEIGAPNLLAVGLKIPENAIFPPSITDIHGAIASIDVAYHLNHRKRGRVMFDESNGTMIEGIGHYGNEPVAGKKEIVCRCENPYPCEFDRGIITAMARRFEKAAVVRHDDTKPCRQRGAESCTYHVTW